MKDVKKSKELKEKGKDYKTEYEISEDYNINTGQLTSLILAESEAKGLTVERFKLSGNVKVLDNGDVGRCYCRAGEAMVEAIEEAYKELGFRVPITGEYLVASSEEGWSGAH